MPDAVRRAGWTVSGSGVDEQPLNDGQSTADGQVESRAAVVRQLVESDGRSVVGDDKPNNFRVVAVDGFVQDCRTAQTFLILRK